MQMVSKQFLLALLPLASVNRGFCDIILVLLRKLIRHSKENERELGLLGLCRLLIYVRDSSTQSAVVSALSCNALGFPLRPRAIL